VYSVIFTQAARAELIEAQDWYEGEATGLGCRFGQAIDALIQRMTVISCFHSSRDPWSARSSSVQVSDYWIAHPEARSANWRA
jgi:hypothetical protein